VIERLTRALADRYRIERELGVGGMATVFLAHDLKHERDVAIKVLHPDLGAALGGDRFLSEIKTTAKLQHPHILPLLDSGEADGLLYYVMPYVSGETLRTRLQRETQLPVADALRIAGQVGDALAEAHEKGIIHRDIKPENILLQGSHALVADFGIALAVQHAGGARLTQTGLSLGTPQYMSPEQAMGDRAVDHRADIYALAAVTYEMLTGEPPHTGANAQAIVAKLLTENVRPPSKVRSTVSPAVDDALLTGLAKLPADRFSSVAEFLAAMRSVTGARPSVRSDAWRAISSAERRRGVLLAMVAVAALAATGGWLLGRTTGSDASATNEGATRFVLEMRRGESVSLDIATVYAISRDGQTLAYVASEGGKPNQIFVRRFDELEARPLAGSQGASNLTFSPDGKWLAFFLGAQIVKLPIEGGQPVRLGVRDGTTPRGLAWLDDGTIVFCAVGTRALFGISSGGGAVTSLRFEAPAGSNPRWPIVLPVAGKVMYTAFLIDRDSTEAYIGDVATGQSVRLNLPLYAPVAIVDDILTYVARSGDMMAVRIDTKTGDMKSAPVRLLSGTQLNTGSGLAYATMSARGDLVYRDREQASQMMFVTRAGLAQPIFRDTAMYRDPRLSPDGRRLAFVRDQTGGVSIWVHDLTTKMTARVSPEDLGTTRDRPEWTPDGRGLIYRARTTSWAGFARNSMENSAPEAQLYRPKESAVQNEVVVAPDGRTYVGRLSNLTQGSLTINQGIGWWREGDSTYHVLTPDTDFHSGPRLSPDGKWLAWSAQVGATREVYVTPFPGPGPRVQVSNEGGGPPVWGHEGRVLFYFQGNRLIESTLDLSASPRVVKSTLLFAGNYSSTDMLHAPFDVARDGRFVLVQPIREARTIVVRHFMTTVRTALALGAGQ
jgi:Tol biopolymer transport system component